MATKPRWNLEDALRRAASASRLAEKHKQQLTPRLDAGLGSQLTADRATLGDAEAKGMLALTAQKTSTSHERATADTAHHFVMAVRNAVDRTKGVPESLRTAIGIGDGLRPADTQKLVASLRAIASQASALTPCGVLASDIAKATTFAADLLTADTEQGKKRDDRAGHTEDRNDVQLRLEASVDQISARGALQFLSDKKTKERFERLVSASGPTKEDEQEAGTEAVTPP
ncbi:MAG: hypothetical protein HYZ28_01095 [Myxococcales bacterium]|nr:hypothetical protein [Myxococcales bacterium]